MKNILVTGGAGFIGSHLCDALIKNGNRVICVDNLQRGDTDNIHHLFDCENFSFYNLDVRNTEAIDKLLSEYKIDKVYHMAANTDLWESMREPTIEDECTFKTTKSLLVAMKKAGVRDMFFASTSAIYGEQTGNRGFAETDQLFPVSYYGAAKMASEAYIYAYAFMNDMNVLIYRFSNIIGQRMTHGVIRDFIGRLMDDPSHLDVRGNGYQSKPYLHVSELIRAIMAVDNVEGVQIYNVGATTCTNVRFIADAVVRELHLEDIPINYENHEGGWKGDVAYYEYNIDKIHNKSNWKPIMTSDETVIRSVAEIANDERIRRSKNNG